MHHGETRGKRKSHKACKKHVNLPKTGGNLEKYWGKNNFREIGEKCFEIGKIGGKIEICG